MRICAGGTNLPLLLNESKKRKLCHLAKMFKVEFPAVFYL